MRPEVMVITVILPGLDQVQVHTLDRPDNLALAYMVWKNANDVQRFFLPLAITVWSNKFSVEKYFNPDELCQLQAIWMHLLQEEQPSNPQAAEEPPTRPR
jgi:hypothetical protein